MSETILIAPNPSQYHAPIYREINRLNNDFEVFFLKENPISLRFSQSDSKSIGIDMLSGYKSRSYAKAKNSNMAILVDIIKIKPKKVIITGYNNIIFFLSPILRAFGVKLYWRGEVYHEFVGAKGWLKKMVLSVYFLFYNKLILSTKRAISIMEDVVSKGSIDYLPCCVDDDYFYSRYKNRILEKEKIKLSLGIKGKWVINATCRLSHEKNVERMIDIMSFMQSDDIELVIIGDGDLKDILKEKVRMKNLTNVSFFGFKNQNEICDFYTISDFSINISHWDYSPKAMAESLHFGLVPIYNENIGTYDEVRDICNGVFISNSLSLEECASKIRAYTYDTIINRDEIAHNSTKYTPRNVSRTSLI
ncbi:hypothetical protein VCRA2119O147_150063 [Vibrio crassostreae]|uniref:glycosyltransferase n=1 Tax=Vibrio crassostreae TaxID=246167 RepID=UPI001BD4B8F4|nr:glycosyltransferase [Vibrio crassostreae]CAK2194874.1 hypothetical protein VCRA2113O138_70041 [Vibrio crassostreae]CAK2230527.1 hypothetical protein VCRA2113O137_80170 [Vibrio crassostreae]CAK2231246.1 hypothetical protein VCRA2113O140_80184 [Vibrio crassostreae]CAK2276716.1 hypothetical protein VCRA2119O145_90171 [Vibrio crassostreae]CAK2277730.1 hypothetical protein VCRA2118O144_90170 [Vibrio crassostreae]